MTYQGKLALSPTGWLFRLYKQYIAQRTHIYRSARRCRDVVILCIHALEIHQRHCYRAIHHRYVQDALRPPYVGVVLVSYVDLCHIRYYDMSLSLVFST